MLQHDKWDQLKQKKGEVKMENRIIISKLKRWSIVIVTVLATYGIMFGGVAIAATSTTLTTDEVTDLTPEFVDPGMQKIPIFSITLTDTVAEDFSRAKARYSGTEKTDIAAIHLYAESTGSGGTFDPGTDILLGTSDPTSTSVFTINLEPVFTFTADIPQQFYFVADIADAASNGNIIDLRIYKNDLTVGENGWPDVGINPDGYSVVESLGGDSTPPVISSVTGNTFGTTGEITTITVVASDNDDVTAAKIFIDGDTGGFDMVESVDDTFTTDVVVPLDSTDNIAYQVYVYDQAGNYAVTDTFIVEVTDNDPPVAEAGPDQTVDEDTEVSFDGTSSSDNIGIVSYEWDFGDGSGEVSAANPTHTYANPGTYTVTLNATDGAGNSSSDTLIVTVQGVVAPPSESELNEIKSLLGNLIEEVNNSAISPKGIKTSLVSKLDAATQKIVQVEEDENENYDGLKAASNILRAFQNTLRAKSKSGKILQSDCLSWSAQAEILRTELQKIINS